MNFGQAFTYAFQDKDWFKKMALPGVCLLIPVVGSFILFGWAIDIVKRVIQHDPEPLPNLEFGSQLKNGFLAWVISIVYNLPLLILYLPAGIFMAVGASLGIDEDTLMTITYVINACCGCLALLYGILAGFMVPAALGKFAAEGSLGAAFKFGEVFSMVKAAPVPYLLVLLGSLLGGLIGGLGVIVCVVGMLLTMAYFYAIYAHLIGQAYIVAKEQV